MTQPPSNNVIPLCRKHRPDEAERPASVHDLVDATRAFDQFERSVAALQFGPVRFADGMQLPAVSVQVELPTTRWWLSRLERINVGNWPDAHWALELSGAVTTAVTRLRATSESLYEQPLGLGPAEEPLATDMEKLVEALSALRALIAHRYPEALAHPRVVKRRGYR